MIQLKIDSHLERRLAQAAQSLGQQPDELALKALESYLEDVEDYARAVAALDEMNPDEVITLEEMKRELGLAD